MIRNVMLEAIRPNPWNTRLGDPDANDINDLAMDIAKNGLLQTPVGRAVEGGVQLAFGHHRLAAYRWLYELRDNSNIPGDYSEMPVDMRELSDEQMAQLAWSENEKRRDHTPIERARAIEKRIGDFGLTQQQVADALGISRSQVANSLRLLKLPDQAMIALADGMISERVAMALVSLYDLPESMRHKAKFSVENIWTLALRGEMTSDNVRKGVDTIVTNYGRKLQGCGWKVEDVFDYPGSRSMTCRDCEMRIKDLNACTDPDCFQSRISKQRSEYLNRAHEISGIPVLEADKTDPTEFKYMSGQNVWNQVIKDSGCQNLRIKYDAGAPRPENENQYIPGFPRAQIVCAKREGFCTCKKGFEATSERKTFEFVSGNQMNEVVLPPKLQLNEKPQTPDELLAASRMARQAKKEARQELEAIKREVAERIATALTMGERKAWKRLGRAIHYSLANTLQNEANLFEIKVQLCLIGLSNTLPDDPDSITDLERHANALLAECGCDPLSQPDELRTVAEERSEPVRPAYAGRPLLEVIGD